MHRNHDLRKFVGNTGNESVAILCLTSNQVEILQNERHFIP